VIYLKPGEVTVFCLLDSVVELLESIFRGFINRSRWINLSLQDIPGRRSFRRNTSGPSLVQTHFDLSLGVCHSFLRLSYILEHCLFECFVVFLLSLHYIVLVVLLALYGLVLPLFFKFRVGIIHFEIIGLLFKCRQV
jgi:hypothetical protein